VLGEDIALDAPLELALAEHVQGVIALDGPRRWGARPQPSPRVHAVLHPSMIRFHDILQILAWSEPTGLWAGAVRLEGGEGRWVRGVFVAGADPGCARMGGLEHFAEATRSRVGFTRGAQPAVQGGTSGVDGPVQVVPRLVALAVRLIHAGRLMGRPQIRPTPLVELWRLAWAPAQHRGRVHEQPPCPRACFPIPVPQGLASLPTDAEQEHVTFTMLPLDRRSEGLQRTSPLI
jgi:hypothetical protein